MCRTAETNAAYLLPHRRLGLRVLDLGCGPGNISVGLARAMDPCTLYGIDREEAQVELAQAVAASQQRENAVFPVGDATTCPLRTAFSTWPLPRRPAAHSGHSDRPCGGGADPEPGGFIGCREMICQSSFTHPNYGVIGKVWEMFEDMIATDDGHPQMGKDLTPG